MFDHIIVELMKSENRHACDEWWLGQSSIKPIHYQPSRIDRLLAAIGETMIRAGSKLKDRPHTRLDAEQAQSPNYMIML